MKEVIIHEHRKTPPVVFDVSTEKKEREAFQELFKIFDTWENFHFEDRIRRAKKEVQRFEEALETESDGQVWVKDARDSDYAESMDVDQAERELESAERKLGRLNKYKDLYVKALDGDADAAATLVRWQRRTGNNYTDYRRVEVKNG